MSACPAGRRGGQLAERDDLRQRLQPRPALLAEAGLDVGGGDRVDEHRQVGLHRLVVGSGLGRSGHGPAEAAPGDRDDPGAGRDRPAAGAAAADAGRLDGHQVRRARPHVTPAGGGLRDARRVRRVDDVGRLVGAGDPQRDPQVGVGPDVRADHAGRALGGQQQVHAERAAAAGDVDEPVDEVGQFRDHGRELVDDQHEPGHRLQVQLGPQPLGVPVVLDVLGPRVQQHLLAPLELGAERVERPHGQVAVEVADHADGVRQPGAVLERAAALVVDEDERHRVGPVGHAEHRDDRLQQLGLPGAGGARDQAVRAVRATGPG